MPALVSAARATAGVGGISIAPPRAPRGTPYEHKAQTQVPRVLAKRCFRIEVVETFPRLEDDACPRFRCLGAGEEVAPQARMTTGEMKTEIG